MGQFRLFILIVSVSFFQISNAQQKKNTVVYVGFSGFQLNKLPGLYLKLNDSTFVTRGICKSNTVIIIHNMALRGKSFVSKQPPIHNSLIKVHGNILYNFSYRSYIDTPFAETNLMQHLVQTNLNFTIKDKYPVAVTITHRNTNSPYFKDYTDVNIQFNQRQLLANIKADLISRGSNLADSRRLIDFKTDLDSKKSQLTQLQAWVNNPARAQEMVLEKDQVLKSKIIASLSKNKDEFISKSSSVVKDILSQKILQKRRGLDSTGVGNLDKSILNNKLKNGLSKDLIQSEEKEMHSIKDKDSSFSQKYNKRKQELESLKRQVDSMEKQARLLAKNTRDSISKIKSEINRITTADSLFAFMHRNNISTDSLTKMQRLLLSVKKIGIGRTMVDYSELTVKNISLTGVNIELNPNRFYFAAAAGKVNYRFRDFVYKNNVQLPTQQLYLIRSGIGRSDKSSIIATFYSGKKSLLNYVQPPAVSSLQKVMGVSIEGKMLIDKNNYIIAEMAKSSYISSAASVPTGSDLFKRVFNLNTHTNEAYSIKLFSLIPSTETRITGYYRKTGEKFQSFNLYSTNANQDAWMARANQYLWNKKFSLDIAIRKNDFVSPVAVQSISSQSIFKSLQATLRLPKYPFVTVGYYPSSQLSLINGNLLTESQYNTLNTIISHNYSLKKISMNSNLVFTRFYNSSRDTGFIYYNATNFVLSHSIFLPLLSFQTTAGIAHQKLLHLFTLDEQVNYQINQYCTITAGAKWNRLNKSQSLFGGNAALNLVLKRLGTLQFNYEKTYLPGNQTNLIPVNLGRMGFYKEF